MLEFYEFNTFNISVVLISTFIIYILLTNFYSHQNNDKKDSKKNNSKNKNKVKPSNSASDDSDVSNDDEKNDEFNLEYLLISFFLSILISLGIAYLKTAKDEEILTEPFWDKLQTANVVDVE